MPGRIPIAPLCVMSQDIEDTLNPYRLGPGLVDDGGAARCGSDRCGRRALQVTAEVSSRDCSPARVTG